MTQVAVSQLPTNLLPTDEVAPNVRFEPCSGYAGDDSAFGCCSVCGWLEHDHELAAGVVRLRARRRVERRAS